MTRILRRRTTTVPHHARGYRPRHRKPVPRRRRRAPYAAAGLLALTGAVAPVARHDRPARRIALTAQPVAPQRFYAAAARPAPVRVRYVTRTVDVPGRVLRGRATWYGPGFDGRRTANGEVFDARHALTAAHRWLPFGTRLRVCRGRRCVVVRINDRGPFGAAILDLSQHAAERLGMLHAGIGEVTATVLTSRQVEVAA